MSNSSRADILTLSNTQAKKLAGRLVTIGLETYCFKEYDPASPGQPPWRSGAEGKAYPLLDYDRAVAAYLKFFTRPTQKRLDRTAWLIAQQMHTWLAGLAAAPQMWIDTRRADGPKEAAMDFAGYLAKAVPGKTWLEVKNSIHANSLFVPDDFRRRCVCDLVLALTVLEQEGIVHGDLSPNNIVIDVDALPDRPVLYLIDFDAFVAPALDGNGSVAASEGGTVGTEGYYPPDLAAVGDSSAAPYSDRYGRDMLMVEFLSMGQDLSPNDPPSNWNTEQLRRSHAAWHAGSDRAWLPCLSHLAPATLLSLKEHDRPSSFELAAGLGLTTPAKRPLRRITWTLAPLSAILGPGPASADIPTAVPSRSSGRMHATPATLNFVVPWRWSRPASDLSYRTTWQDVKLAILLALPFLVILAVGLVNLLIH